jgi:hypothetical protein
MPSRAAVLDMLENQQPQIRRLPDIVSTTASLTLTHRTHAGKVIGFNAAAGLTVTLPPVTAATAGETYTVILQTLNTATSNHVITPSSTDTFNGGTSGLGLMNEGSTDAVGDSVSVISDGSGWLVLNTVGTWLTEA